MATMKAEAARRALDGLEIREPPDADFRRWLLDGIAMMDQGAPRHAAAVAAALRAFLHESGRDCDVSQFVAELCEIETLAATTAAVREWCERTTTLHERYRAWKIARGGEPISITAFGRALGDMGFRVVRRGPRGRKMRVGLRLRGGS